MSQLRTINVSVYYNRKNWHRLIEECLSPFLEATHAEVSDFDSYIYLGTASGTYLKLFFRLPKEEEINFKTRFEQELNSFFLDCPIETKPVYPIKSFFMDCPEKSILYTRMPGRRNWFDILFKAKKAHHYLTKLILDVLSEDVIDEESVFNLSIYLQFTLLKSLKSQVNDLGAFSRTLLERWEELNEASSAEQMLSEADFEDLFESNVEMLVEILDDVWTYETNSSLQWLAEWEEICTEHFKKEGTFLQESIDLIHIIGRHLSVSNQEVKQTLRLINRTLERVGDGIVSEPAQ